MENDIKNSLIVSGRYCRINYAVTGIVTPDNKREWAGCGPFGRTYTRSDERTTYAVVDSS